MDYNLTLTRTAANRSYTWGLLSCDGKPAFGVVTMQMRLHAYAYHKTPDCVGLSKTKCIIRKVSKDEVAKTRKPCGYCYGYIRRGKDLNNDSTYIAR